MATEKLWCQAGNHHWERQAKRGRKPTICPDHSGEPKLAPVQPADLEARLEKARKVKAQKAKQREREAAADKRKELASLRKALPKLDAEYSKWLDRASKATSTDKIKEAFDKADQLQSQIIGAHRTIKRLETEMEGV